MWSVSPGAFSSRPGPRVSRSSEASDVTRHSLILARSWPINTGSGVRATLSSCGIFSVRVCSEWTRTRCEWRESRLPTLSVLSLREHVPAAMTTRGIRRKKSSLSEVKVAVIGAPSVGKSGTWIANCDYVLQFVRYARMQRLKWSLIKSVHRKQSVPCAIADDVDTMITCLM